MSGELAGLAHLLRGARRVFVLTGAGISTDSGIDDYRGPNGMWTNNPAAARLFDIEAYRSDRQVRVASWRMRMASPIRTAAPNDGHRALAAWQEALPLDLATQNIDGLHQRAGSRRVIELHGSYWFSRCLDCGARGPIEETFARVAAGEEDPACLTCGGILRTSTIAFGQALEDAVWESAVRAALRCDLALAIGTSLAVQPAASLCETAVRNGAAFVVINEQPTAYDGIATLALHRRIGPVLAGTSTLLDLPPVRQRP